MVNWDFTKYSPNEILDQLIATNLPAWVTPYCEFLKEFIQKEKFIVHTSGTTGNKKKITVTKQQMLYSARATLTYFNLTKGKTVLLPLSCEFIAGKMMLVRAIEGKLNLFIVKPTTNFNSLNIQKIDFCPLVPLQVEGLLNSPFIKRINVMLIGGGAVPLSLIKKLRDVQSRAFESFGMTETLTHFALRMVSPKKEDYFTTLPGFRIDISEKNELILLENKLNPNALKTNDLIEKYSSTQFKWIGRSDHLIKSGGILFVPEEIEHKISKHIFQPFVIIGVKNPKFGEVIALVVEGREKVDIHSLNKYLSKFERIKKQFSLLSFPKTESGKVKRTLIKQIINA